MAIDPPGEASHSSTHSIDEPSPSRCNSRRNNIDYDSVTEHENIIDDDNNNNASANAADEWNSDPHHGFSSLSGSSSASASLPKFNSTSLVVVRNNNSPPSSSRGGSSSNNGHGAFEYNSSNYDAQEEQQLVQWTTKKDDGNNNNNVNDDDKLRHSERSGYTEKLSDFDIDYAVGEEEDFDDDEDFDVCEERYRQPRDCSPPRPMDPDDYQMVPATAIAGPTAASTIINTTTTTTIANNSNNNNNNNNQLALPQQRQQQAAAAPPTLPKYNGYLHHFITVNDNHKFLLLYTFLQRHSTHTKIILFFSTPQTTRYHAKLLARLKFDVSVLLPAHHHDPRNRHHRQSSSQYSKERLLETYLEFSNKRKESGILCLPDCMGKEFSIPPTTGWVVQFEPPEDPSEYIFRVGRVASEMGGRNTGSAANDGGGNGGAGTGNGGGNNAMMMGGRALLFLTPKEFGFLDYYHATNTKIYEYELPKLANVQRNYERLLRKDDKLRRLAREAYFAYILQYASHEYRDVYNVHDLEEEMVALSFGFVEPPSRSGSPFDVDWDGDYYCYEEGKEEDCDHYGREKRNGGGGRVRESSSRQRRGREKQKTMWMPEKKHSRSKDGSSWMHGEKTWKHADRHASAMKTQSHKRGDADDLKPSSIKFR